MVRITTAILLAFVSSAASVPGISFPINSQVPPVARVLKPFNFTFPATTFTVTSPPLIYNLIGTPAWLQLDGGSRTFSGTPGAGDVGAKDFQLVASDGSGSSTMPVTFVVSADPGPGLGVPLAQQLSAFGTLSASQSLVLYPSKPFSISFSPGTFTNTNDQTNYYAACANNTPLPSWIYFDAKDLSFSGSTPTFTSPSELPQDFSIELTASDVTGFSGAVATFHIIVSDHVLAFESETINIESIPGQPLNSSGLGSSLTLDSKPTSSLDLKWIQADTPDWLFVDSKTLYISGTPPSVTATFQFNLSVTDVYDDTASTLVVVSTNSSTALISGKIGAASAIVGTKFSYTFDSSLFPVMGTGVTLNLGSAASWLKFDATTLTLQGDVPDDLNTQQIILSLTATHVSQSQTQNFQLAILEGQVSSSTSYLQTADTTVTSSTSLLQQPTVQPKIPDKADSGAQGKDIAAAVVLPIVALLGVGLLAYWCYRRRRAMRRSQSSIAAWKKSISRPFLIEEPPFEATREKPIIHHKRVPSRPPIIPELPNMRGTYRNSTHQATAESLNRDTKRLSKRESRLNITYGHSLWASIARGTRQEESTVFTLVGEQLSRPGEIHTARGGSISKGLNIGIGHEKAPKSLPSVLDPSTHASQLLTRGSQIPADLTFGKSKASNPGGPFGYGQTHRSIQNASSDGWGTTDESSNSSPRPTLENFPKPPRSSVRTVSPFFQSGSSTKEKSGRGLKYTSNSQTISDASLINHPEEDQAAVQGSSSGEHTNRRQRASFIYSRPPSACPVHSPPPVPSMPHPSLKSSPSWAFLKGLKTRQLKTQPSNLTAGSEGRFADAIESEDEIGGDYVSSPNNGHAPPIRAAFPGRSIDHLAHPGPLTANGISIRTWRSSRDLHQTSRGTHSADGSSGRHSSTSSTSSEAQGEAHHVGMGEVGRKVSVESSIQRNRPTSRSMRAETEGAFL